MSAGLSLDPNKNDVPPELLLVVLVGGQRSVFCLPAEPGVILIESNRIGAGESAAGTS
jgi:hypothetical protein